VLAAALVNRLARDRPAELTELTELAAALRDAHRHLRGPELRQLSERRQAALAALTELARRAPARPPSEAVLGQVRATFEAAIADEDAERAVLSGRLTAALSYSGFGAVDLGDAVAVPNRLRAVPTPAEPAAAESATGGRAERALRRAERDRAAALDALDRAVEQLDDARAEQAELAARTARLRDELAAAERAGQRAAGGVAAAERAHRTAARALERAEQALAEAGADPD